MTIDQAISILQTVAYNAGGADRDDITEAVWMGITALQSEKLGDVKKAYVMGIMDVFRIVNSDIHEKLLSNFQEYLIEKKEGVSE